MDTDDLLRRDDAERYALEWARSWFTLEEVRAWLDAGARPQHGPAAAALRDVGVPPEAGCLPLYDDGTFRPGGLPLVARIEMDNISAAARVLLARGGYLLPESQPADAPPTM